MSDPRVGVTYARFSAPFCRKLVNALERVAKKEALQDQHVYDLDQLQAVIYALSAGRDLRVAVQVPPLKSDGAS